MVVIAVKMAQLIVILAVPVVVTDIVALVLP